MTRVAQMVALAVLIGLSALRLKLAPVDGWVTIGLGIASIVFLVMQWRGRELLVGVTALDALLNLVRYVRHQHLAAEGGLLAPYGVAALALALTLLWARPRVARSVTAPRTEGV